MRKWLTHIILYIVSNVEKARAEDNTIRLGFSEDVFFGALYYHVIL